MSVEATTELPDAPFTLGQFIAALIDALGEAHPAALTRLRQVVGHRRARIRLDEDVVDVFYVADGLLIQPAVDNAGIDGEGATTSAAVLALLDGHLEITDALLDGQLRVTGAAENIVRIFIAIEILLDASARTPALQTLAARFRAEKREHRPGRPAGRPRNSWYPFASGPGEYELLARLDLLL
jgi:hypothetical protein